MDIPHGEEGREAKWKLLKQDIEIGIESGEASEMDESSIDDVKARGRVRLAADPP